MPSATKLTKEKRAKFLQNLAEQGNVSKSAEVIGVRRESLYKLRNNDDDFAEAWDEAVKKAADSLEAEAWRRAVKGVDRELHYQGRLTGELVKEYSDTLLIFLLKGNKPEKFKDRQHLEANHSVTGRATVVFESNGREVTDDEQDG